VDKPRRWNVNYIRNFMIVFGLISSAFDFITFGTLLLVLKATEEQFRTGWFIESLFTELLILLVVRTRRPLFKSKPGRWLWISSLLVGATALVMPYLPWVSQIFSFVPLPALMMALLLAITLLYVVVNEVAKQIFYRKVRY
jgi:Mg2+-importing ATPase